jgi:flavodoxin
VKAIVVYDSAYGNTEQIARAIGEALDGDVRRTGEVRPEDLSAYDLIVVGSPTQGGRPTHAVTAFIDAIPVDRLKDRSVAAFDTRIPANERGFLLRAFMGVLGYAAPRIGDRLSRRGGRLAAPPEGFIVEDREGPLREGELQRARDWASRLLA